MFDPKTDRYPYPEYTDRHYLKVKMDRGIVFDSEYPYIDNSRSFLFVDFLVRVLLRTIVFPMVKIKLGLKIIGKENLKKYKDVLDDGFVTVCNHVHMWDYLGILFALRPRKAKIISWAANINGENGPLVRHVGGIPIPESGAKATKAYLRAIQDHLKEGGWLHIYAEGSMWEYYAPIRPFKTGASYFAIKNNKPVLPLAYSYRKPGWIRKHIFKQEAVFTLNIGEPLYADDNLLNKEKQNDLTARCHKEVCRLAGFKENENIYPPLFNNTKRIDYYTKEYGIGYKS